MDYTMVYSEERGTWNIFCGAEWYAEGTYEQMERMMDNIRICEAEEQDDYYRNDYECEYEYEEEF